MFKKPGQFRTPKWEEFDLLEKFLILLIMVFACFLLLMGFFPPYSFGETGLWDYSFIYSDNPTIQIAWDPGRTCPTGMTCGYEVELRHLEQPFIDKYNVPTTSCTASYKKSGHYEVFVRGWQSSDMVSFTYSDWAQSTKAGQISIGVPTPVSKGWLLYWRLPVPSGGGIN
jgi:hypothetical protein